MAMVSAMMKQTTLHAGMMVETAVDMSRLITVLTALAFLKRLALKDIFPLQLEMVFVMMKTTMYTATLMDLIAVSLLLIHPFVLNANVMVSL